MGEQQTDDLTTLVTFMEPDPHWDAMLAKMKEHGGWPFDNNPDVFASLGIPPDVFDEPSDKSKAIWERNCRPIIEQIARVRTEG